MKSTVLEGLFVNQVDSIFEQCFHTCKSCLTLGNEENHQCEECIIGYDYNSEVSIGKNCYKVCKFNIYFDSLNKLQCTTDDKCPKSYKLIAPKKNVLKIVLRIINTLVNTKMNVLRIVLQLNTLKKKY